MLQIEKENLSLRTELASLQAVYKQNRERNMALENKIRIYESSLDALNNKISNRERQIDDLSRRLKDQQNVINKKEQEKEKQKKKFDSKLAVEVDKRDRLHELKQAKLQDKLRVKDEKLRLLSNIIQSDELSNNLRATSTDSLDNVSEEKTQQRTTTAPNTIITTATTTHTPRLDTYTATSVTRVSRAIYIYIKLNNLTIIRNSQLNLI